MRTDNNILDIQRPMAPFYEKHISNGDYGCPICKSETGSRFAGIRISENDLISFDYNCQECGNTSSQDFSLYQIKDLMKAASRGSVTDFWECWCLVKFYPHLINNPVKYKKFCCILDRPAGFTTLAEEKKTRFQAAWEMILRGKKLC